MCGKRSKILGKDCHKADGLCVEYSKGCDFCIEVVLGNRLNYSPKTLKRIRVLDLEIIERERKRREVIRRLHGHDH